MTPNDDFFHIEEYYGDTFSLAEIVPAPREVVEVTAHSERSDIASMTSSASSGNTAFKLSLQADYTLSKLLTMTFYYDRQTNTPLLSSSSYPTTTQDFGFALKVSLTR
jgi:cell surface protein SprA